MSKTPPSPDVMIAVIDKLPRFAAQQMVNGWYKAYGAEAVREVQAELNRRSAKVEQNTQDEDTGAHEEAEYYAELNRGYAKDRA